LRLVLRQLHQHQLLRTPSEHRKLHRRPRLLRLRLARRPLQHQRRRRSHLVRRQLRRRQLLRTPLERRKLHQSRLLHLEALERLPLRGHLGRRQLQRRLLHLGALARLQLRRRLKRTVVAAATVAHRLPPQAAAVAL
tara:strand:+ start:115 stop:525 length:411 start_codon:yes stop_codon:yes gene_type:complete